jgi:hypothetical protein
VTKPTAEMVFRTLPPRYRCPSPEPEASLPVHFGLTWSRSHPLLPSLPSSPGLGADWASRGDWGGAGPVLYRGPRERAMGEAPGVLSARSDASHRHPSVAARLGVPGVCRVATCAALPVRPGQPVSLRLSGRTMFQDRLFTCWSREPSPPGGLDSGHLPELRDRLLTG